jgi:hypothetical protein
MARRFAWIAGLVWVTVGCSSSDTHPPRVLDNCSSNCDPPTSGLTSSGGGGAKGTTDAGSKPDAGTTTPGFGCFKDPTSGVTLCSSSLLCQGVVIDQTGVLQGCGFVDLGRPSGAADVECLCSGGEVLCPITTAANCPTLPGLLSQQTAVDICNQQFSSNRCIDFATLPKGDAGKCTNDCIRSCGSAPLCLSLCNC